MAVTVDGLQLYTADESTSATEAQVDAISVIGQDPGEAIITSLTAAESPTVAGRTTGIGLLDEGYPSDVTASSNALEDQVYAAIAEWVQEFASLVNPEQGAGVTVDDDERDRSLTATVTEGSWTLAQGAPYQVLWSLTLQRGDGVATSTARSPSTQTPGTSTTLGGEDLGSIREKRTELKIDVQTTPLAFGDVDATIIVPESGTLRRVTIDGRRSASASTLRSFDDTLRGYLGGNSQQTYQTAFPGTSHDVVVASYDSTFTAGSPSVLEYSLSLIEGLTLATGD